MKLSIPQQNLAKALSNVARIATAQSGNAMLGNVLLRTDTNKLIVSATNLEVVIVYTIPARVESEGAITVPARILADFVAKLPNTTVELNVEHNLIKVKAGGFSSTINATDAEEYPAIPESEEPKQFVVSGADLKLAVNRTIVAVSSDTTRPIFTGVCFCKKAGKLVLAATDGYRLAESKTNVAIECDLNFVVPSSALQDVVRVIESNNDVIVKYSDDQVSFIIDDARVTSRLIDGSFINYDNLIPTENKFNIKVNRGDLLKATKMAEPFTHPANIITLKTGKHSIAIRSVAGQVGVNSSELEAEVKGKESSINLNVRYVIDAINCINGEDITLRYNDPNMAILLSGDDDNYTHLVMPVRS